MTRKYNYLKDYELAAKYGVSPQEYAVDSTKSWCLNNIANELAEANRLKRLELMSKFHGAVPSKFELGDKADG